MSPPAWRKDDKIRERIIRELKQTAEDLKRVKAEAAKATAKKAAAEKKSAKGKGGK